MMMMMSMMMIVAIVLMMPKTVIVKKTMAKLEVMTKMYFLRSCGNSDDN